HVLEVAGCATSSAGSLGVDLSAPNAKGPGTFTMGGAIFTDASGQMWGAAGDPFSMTVTQLGASGGVIAGTFSSTVTHGGNAAHSLSGSFNVCHVEDEAVP